MSASYRRLGTPTRGHEAGAQRRSGSPLYSLVAVGSAAGMSSCPTPRRPIGEAPVLSALVFVHERLATSLLLFMVAVGLWGLASFVRGGTLSGSLAATFLIGQVLIAVQVLAGVVLVLAGHRPVDTTHYLYGATALVVLPFAWSYLRERHPRHGLLMYSLLALFVAGLAVRGMTTGG